LETTDSQDPGSFTEAPISYDDLLQRPQFKANLDPLLHSLAEVLTPYSFSKEAPCGLSTCHQGHLHGFLVRTATGEETNIGHVCGKRHFGEDFDVANAAYRRIADRRKAVNQILALKEQSYSVRQQVQELLDQPFGVRWVNRLIGCLQVRIGPIAFAHLAARAKSEDYGVLKVVERSEEEIVKIMRDSGKRRDQVRYVEEHVGRLPPMGWLRWDFRKELIQGVNEAFKIIGELSPECETKRLNDASKACFGWEVRLRNAQTHLTDAQRFLGADALGITDIALEEFFTRHAEPEGDWRLTQWIQTSEAKALAAGMSKVPEPAALPAKPLSKGKQRKLRRKH